MTFAPPAWRRLRSLCGGGRGRCRAGRSRLLGRRPEGYPAQPFQGHAALLKEPEQLGQCFQQAPDEVAILEAELRANPLQELLPLLGREHQVGETSFGLHLSAGWD
jgi:hypothetical protein